MPNRDEISSRHLSSLWASVRDTLDALTAGKLEALLERPDTALLAQALASDAQRLGETLLRRRPSPAPVAAAPRPRAKVLVIDDDPATLETLVELLSESYDVRGTTEPTQVARLLGEDLPDAVVTDLYMPGLDGLALMELVQASSTPAPPVLFMSGSLNAAERLKALEGGAFDFLTKPVDVDELCARINRGVTYSNELRRQSMLQQTDELTGLRNRRSLKAWLAAALDEARRTGEPLTAVMIDQDGLKAINDAFGHAVGDESIVAVAKALSGACRDCDAVARLGGDEFALVMRGPASNIADRIDFVSRRLGEARLTGAGSTGVRISWGIATARPEDDGATLLARADEALYRMKRERGAERLRPAPGIHASTAA